MYHVYKKESFLILGNCWPNAAIDSEAKFKLSCRGLPLSKSGLRSSIIWNRKDKQDQFFFYNHAVCIEAPLALLFPSEVYLPYF